MATARENYDELCEDFQRRLDTGQCVYCDARMPGLLPGTVPDCEHAVLCNWAWLTFHETGELSAWLCPACEPRARDAAARQGLTG